MKGVLNVGDFVERRPEWFDTPRGVWTKGAVYRVTSGNRYGEINLEGVAGLYSASRFVRVDPKEPINLNDFL